MNNLVFDESNELFQLALKLINESGRNIFLTGKAGTGKTTFLKHIQQHCWKQMAIVAPTGVAAINAGGVTIHSLFQLPLSIFIPCAENIIEGNVLNTRGLLSRLQMNSQKRKILQEIELLVIDEISMVRCDVLDAMDVVLKHIRKNNQLFGGVQVLFIGDMFQLPPVTREYEWPILANYYSSPYFFDSQCIRDNRPICIEFEKVYRQTDEEFINLLNQVRNNALDENSLRLLQSRYDPDFEGEEGSIILTTHNDTARAINKKRLDALEGFVRIYKASVEGDFPDTAFPAEENLILKVGAQVMFIRNDMEREKRYYNGKVGLVTRLEPEKIFVKCVGNDEEIEVKHEKWDNISYNVDRQTRKVDKLTLGVFSQFPLRLAWAITIHKSQGLTFDNAIIDPGRSFATGQVYVALSRCRSLEGIVLKSRISPGSLQNDPRIVRFSESRSSSELLQVELQSSGFEYRLNIILDLFDFGNSVADTEELMEYVIDNRAYFNEELFPWIENLRSVLSQQQVTAIRFHDQLRRIFRENDLDHIQKRIAAGAEHFAKETNEVLKTILECPAVTDSLARSKEFNNQLKDIFSRLAFKNHQLEGCKTGFDIHRWGDYKARFRMPAFNVNAYSAKNNRTNKELEFPDLYYKLKKLRDEICEEKNRPIYMVAGSQTLYELATYLPQNDHELGLISGFGPAKIESYGNYFLDIIREYAGEKGLGSRIELKEPKRPRKEKRVKPGKTPSVETPIKTDTREESYRLFREGKSPEEIAAIRKLTVQTIEGHLAFYVRKGVISIEELLDHQKIILIEPLLENNKDNSLTALKEKLGPSIGYGEIRLVIAWNDYKKEIGELS